MNTKTLLFVYFLLALLSSRTASAKEWFVRQAEPTAADTPDGSADHPLRTINAAAQLAQPGDVVTVGAGIYHEWVSPARGGDATAPIRYRSIPGHAAIVRGTDVLEAQWQSVSNAPGVFTTPLPQPAFIFGNPFAGPRESKRNALVFVKDQPLSQATNRQQLVQTPGSWLASDDAQELLIHLEGATVPAPGAIEITTRDRIFAPHRRGLSYIDVEGFVFERCATRPGWPQLGALSTRTGIHWTMRNNIVRYTTGKGIDCGSETWDPESLSATDPQDKRILIGGHHVVEGNLITDNAQCGIAAWNTDYVRIIGNVVRNNAASASADNISLTDFEAGGIKVHAFRNGLLEGNLVISNCSFGIWLDNGWENARVTRNVIIGNHGAGIFIELGFGPILLDHNLSAANVRLGPLYFGDGIYTHDASGITIAHNTLLDNAHYGLEQLVVTERAYADRRLAEASNQTITGNFFYGNHDAAMSLPIASPRSRDNHSDHNAFDPAATFVINNNAGRIPMGGILQVCGQQLQAAHVPENERPDMSDAKRPPSLSLPAWRVVMQMDQNSKPLPANLRVRLDQHETVLQVDLPSLDTIPTTPADPADNFDLLGNPIKNVAAHAGAFEPLHSGTIRIWPLPVSP
ncbi:MAG: hypothetical protein C5B50_25755 [Verrucomicrobia bacterium]|nr:MAG: hypothetical protein C5B50_25755 [Verrucomicrobiota bacterium]